MKKVILLVGCFYITIIINGMVPQKSGKMDGAGCVVIHETFEVENVCPIPITESHAALLNTSAWDVKFKHGSKICNIDLPNFPAYRQLYFFDGHAVLPFFPGALPVELLSGKKVLEIPTKDGKFLLVLRRK